MRWQEMLKEMFMGQLFCVQVLFCKGKAWYTEDGKSEFMKSEALILLCGMNWESAVEPQSLF